LSAIFAVALSPNDALVLGNLADAYRASATKKNLAPEIYRKAISLGERQLALEGRSPLLLLSLSLYTAKIADKEAALKYLEQAKEVMHDNPVLLYQLAIVHELTGSRDQALNSLEGALEAGYPVDEVNRDPELLSLRKDTRYGSIVGRQAP
jgi:serine/threonine-protein kinase